NLFADNLSFLEGHGNGTYEEARPIDGISSAVDLVADDADHDGDVDLILTNNGLTLARNRGNGDFIAETMGEEFTATAILPFDFDGDGDRDLAVTRANGEPVILLRANGDGTYGDQSSVEEEVEPNGLESVDLDGDGDLNLVSSHS